MVSAALLAILAFGHVLSAVGWLGGGLLVTFVLGPNLVRLAPAARLEFNAKILPRVIRFVEVTIGTTFLFGLLLLYVYFNGNFTFLSGTAQGLELSSGIILALGDAVLANAIIFPTFRKVIRMSNDLLQGGQQAPPPELLKYSERARLGSLIGVFLLIIVLALMVFAGFGFY